MLSQTGPAPPGTKGTNGTNLNGIGRWKCGVVYGRTRSFILGGGVRRLFLFSNSQRAGGYVAASLRREREHSRGRGRGRPGARTPCQGSFAGVNIPGDFVGIVCAAG